LVSLLIDIDRLVDRADRRRLTNRFGHTADTREQFENIHAWPVAGLGGQVRRRGYPRGFVGR